MKAQLISLFIIFNISLFSCTAREETTTYSETKNAATTDTIMWTKTVLSPQFYFASSNIHYSKENIPKEKLSKSWSVIAWQGEKVHTQLLYFDNDNIENLGIKTTILKNKQGNTIPQSDVSIRFIRYVKTDVFAGGCDSKTTTEIDSSLVADPIDLTTTLSYQKYTTQPLWLSIQIPKNTAPGTYSGKVLVEGSQTLELPYEVIVSERTLPPTKDWKFDLDLWQHPYAIARMHNVKAWSDAHFDWMKKYYTMLANAGQKVITASIINEAWNHQTYDDYPSLIQWTKNKNGTWSYDYSLFDKYIQFVMDCGINTRINCYSMIPWKIQFEYFDESTGKKAYITDKPGSKAYNDFWGNMLKDFRQHLIQKSWFQKTAIAMDERSLTDMQAVIKLVKDIDQNFNISLAGEYHKEIEPFISDYCVPSRWTFPDEILAKRKKMNQPSTVYTCCTEEYPNGFTFSPPAENAWLPWYAAAKGFTGYVRWAYNSWVKDPLLDSRFRTWPGGDTYQVYPGPRTSIRFEKLIEGIQDFEKIQILEKEFTAKNQQEKLKELKAILKLFRLENFPKISAEATLEEAKARLEKL